MVLAANTLGVSFFLLQRLVVKPDQLIKRRGKLGLVGVNLDLNGVKEWLKPRLMKETMVRVSLSAVPQTNIPLRLLPSFTLCFYDVAAMLCFKFHVCVPCQAHTRLKSCLLQRSSAGSKSVQSAEASLPQSKHSAHQY